MRPKPPLRSERLIPLVVPIANFQNPRSVEETSEISVSSCSIAKVARLIMYHTEPCIIRNHVSFGSISGSLFPSK